MTAASPSLPERIFIKPASPDVRVRKPVGGLLAVEGEEVNRDSFWLRRLADGDVVETKAATPKGK